MQKIVVLSRHSILVAGFRALVADPARLTVIECVEIGEVGQAIVSKGTPTAQQLTRRTAETPGNTATSRVSPERSYTADSRISSSTVGPPDIILVDVDSIVTLACLNDLKSLAPNAGLILWVDWISPEFIREAIHWGVQGILRKTTSARLYAHCLEQVGNGQFWLESEMNQNLLLAKTVRLSLRERQLVALLTEGLRNKEIAGCMNITEGTVKAYLSRLFKKTGASDRFELAMFALRNIETNPAAGPSRGPRIFLPLRAAFSRRA